jgi:hypothetical protein
MSTRANIKFQDGNDFIHVDRSHDGFPENILADIKETIDLCKNRWSDAELGQLVSAFLGMHFDKNTRIQNYEPCIGYEKAGDESYCYFVSWNKSKREYEFGLIE